jgi:nitrogen regulatory protein PII
MNYMVILIVNDPDHCPAILEAWEEIGVSGVTVLESSGLGHYRHSILQEDTPLIPSLSNLFQGGEKHHRTVFSVVDSQEMVNRLIDEAQQIIGDLETAHSGFLFVVPVERVIGYGKGRENR